MTKQNPNTAITRRDLIRAGLGGTLALQFGAGAFAQALTVQPRARAVIEVWMWGGPSQIDTFDPKPKLKELHLQEFVREGVRVVLARARRMRGATPASTSGNCCRIKSLYDQPPCHHHFLHCDW